jgi:hypothetical protein
VYFPSMVKDALSRSDVFGRRRFGGSVGYASLPFKTAAHYPDEYAVQLVRASLGLKLTRFTPNDEYRIDKGR